MRRRWVIAGTAAVVLAAGAGIAAQQLTRTDRRTTARTLEEAISDFRTDASAEVGSAMLPGTGVYVYRTSGGDGVDALGGAEHTYPATTTITVRASECGVTTRWDVAVERWEETTACPVEGGVRRSTFVAYHEFFGTGDTDRERCDGDARPVVGEAGATWSFTCVEGESSTTWAGTVVGRDAVDVDGVAVPTDHVVLTTEDDPDDDAMRIETWFLAGNDLIVREIGQRRTTDPSPIGDVHYLEQYEIVLTSLEPLR